MKVISAVFSAILVLAACNRNVMTGSKLTLDYKVAGFANGGGEKLAPAVDGVLTEQLKRFRTYATGRPRT